MISMTNVQQLLQREPAAPATTSSAQSGFAESYAQATESALQNAATSREPSEAPTSDRPVEATQLQPNRPKWMALFNEEAPSPLTQQSAEPSVSTAPLMTEQPIDPAQTDATPALQAVAVAAPQLAPTNANKPVVGQPTMTEQPVTTSQTDKVATDLRAIVTNPAQR